MTGVSARTRRIVLARDNESCVWCGFGVRFSERELQHRRARGAGGSKAADTNLPGNLVLLHGDCHREVESNRAQAVSRGFNVRQGVAPVLVPLQDHTGFWWLLADDGTKTCIPVLLAAEYRVLYGMTGEVA